MLLFLHKLLVLVQGCLVLADHLVCLRSSSGYDRRLVRFVLGLSDFRVTTALGATRVPNWGFISGVPLISQVSCISSFSVDLDTVPSGLRHCFFSLVLGVGLLEDVLGDLLLRLVEEVLRG